MLSVRVEAVVLLKVPRRKAREMTRPVSMQHFFFVLAVLCVVFVPLCVNVMPSFQRLVMCDLVGLRLESSVPFFV